jgi:hypothetical protein
MAITGNIMAATETITAAAEGRETGGKRPGRAALLLAGAIGLALLAGAVPRLVAAVAGLPARPVLWDAYAGRTLPLPDLLEAADALDRAAALGDAVAAGERGFLLLRAATLAPLEDRFPLLAAAEGATIAALNRAPGNPSLWLRLAHLREGRGDRAGALAAWRLSVLSGRFEPAIMADRLRMGARLLALMDADTRGLLKRQFRNGWTLSLTLAEAVRAMPGMAPLAEEALDSLTARETAAFTRNHGGPPPSRP